MKKFLIALGCMMALSSCAMGYYDHHHGGAGYVYYDGYYDNFYGPVAYGYWGPDGYYYYRTGASGVYVRDDARHFRHDRGDGNWRPFHMRGQRPPN